MSNSAKNSPLSLALNYSPQAVDLLRSGQIQIDLFKCPPWPETVKAASAVRPAYVHFGFHSGGFPPDQDDLHEASQWLENTPTSIVNTHLAPRKRLFNGTGSSNEDYLVARELAVADITSMTRFFGRTQVAVENVPFETRAEYEIHQLAATPELLNDVIETCDCQFLLDLAHARFAAGAYGIPVRDLIEAYPTQRLVELHVTGLGPDDQGRQRDSMPMTDEDWELLDWALSRIAQGHWRRPNLVALEYGGIGPLFDWRSDAEILAQQVPRVTGLLASHGLI